jgi:hypothetical protein
LTNAGRATTDNRLREAIERLTYWKNRLRELARAKKVGKNQQWVSDLLTAYRLAVKLEEAERMKDIFYRKWGLVDAVIRSRSFIQPSQKEEKRGNSEFKEVHQP